MTLEFLPEIRSCYRKVSSLLAIGDYASIVQICPSGTFAEEDFVENLENSPELGPFPDSVLTNVIIGTLANHLCVSGQTVVDSLETFDVLEVLVDYVEGENLAFTTEADLFDVAGAKTDWTLVIDFRSCKPRKSLEICDIRAEIL